MARLPLEDDLVFLIMSFLGDGMGEVHSAIQAECAHLGLRAKRVDELVGSGLVIKDVAQLIIAARFIICDLTYERPNVYYELGFAHGVGNGAGDILLIARAGTSLHFDIAPLRVKYYSSIEDLRSLVNFNLRAMREAIEKRRAVRLAAPASNL